MQYRGVGRYVQGAVARDELPDEVIPRLHYVLRLANVLGALLVRVELGPAPGLPQSDQTGLDGSAAGHDERIVGPLQVEKGILEGERARRFHVDPISHPSESEFAARSISDRAYTTSEICHSDKSIVHVP